MVNKLVCSEHLDMSEHFGNHLWHPTSKQIYVLLCLFHNVIFLEL